MMRTVFMGTPEIAVPALRLLAVRTTVTCVVTQPDRPAGRGHQLQAPPVKVAAGELGLPVWQPETLKGQAAAPHLAGADLFVVMAYGELLRQEVLDLPRGGCINLHGSLLPRWRGASPLQAALRAGDTETGVAVMRMVRGLDAGPVYLSERLPLTPATTLPALHDALAELAATALGHLLDRWPGVVPQEQDERLVTVCRKLTPEDGHLDFTRSGAELERWVRAYTPAPGCWAQVADGRLRIMALAPRPAVVGLAAGELRAAGGELLVGCADGACAVLRLQPPGKRAMAAADFLNGHQVPARFA
jgi:methionyl-tRNA formyltransferase